MVKLRLFLMAIIVLSASYIFANSNTTLKHNAKEKSGCYTTNYGQVNNNTILIRSSIRPNEFMSNVFSKFNIDSKKAFAVSNYSTEIIDTKRFRAGNKYAFLLKKVDNKLKASSFIYEKNVVEYAVFNFNKNEVEAEVKRKPIERKKITSAAIIKGSLYQTMINVDVNPLLALELAEVYKWTIDFYRIQENDFFKVIYWEEFVEGNSIGEFEIEACSFNHLSKDHRAFTYKREDSEKIEYFDEEGNTLKQFFLQAPVAYSRISSPYSKNRFHPVTKKNKPHLGTDYAAPTGTPIYSTANGVVTHAKYTKYNGNYVKIQHNDTYTTQYLHMSKIASGIKPGKYVEQGQVIGYVGSTGLATGPHVCYRFWKNGKQVDPYSEITPKADPLSKKELPSYLLYIEPLNNQLDKLTL